MNTPEHEVGDLLGGRFVLVEPLGKGSFGSVWRAADCENGAAPCAVKILFESHRRHPKKFQRFVQEGRILAQLDHPNIAKMIAANFAGDEVYVAMELIDGEPLHARIEAHAQNNRLIPVEGVSWLSEQLGSAIVYAHSKNVVHRDLKPRNVMVNRTGTRPFLKVLDFGIAKMMVGSAVDPTTVGRMLGSLMYVAPEQLRGQPIDRRADVFALATLLFEVLTLRRTWARDEENKPLDWRFGIGDPEINSHVAIARRIVREERPRPSQFRRELPESVDRTFARALAIDPLERYEDVAAFTTALREGLVEAKHGVLRVHEVEPTIEE